MENHVKATPLMSFCVCYVTKFLPFTIPFSFPLRYEIRFVWFYDDNHGVVKKKSLGVLCVVIEVDVDDEYPFLALNDRNQWWLHGHTLLNPFLWHIWLNLLIVNLPCHHPRDYYSKEQTQKGVCHKLFNATHVATKF